MQIGPLDFKELDPGTDRTPLVLEAPQRIDIVRFVQTYAAGITRVWEEKPVFLIKNIWEPRDLGVWVRPDLAPTLHCDVGGTSPERESLGIFLVNNHGHNTRGATEYREAPHVLSVLDDYDQQLDQFSGTGEGPSDFLMVQDLKSFRSASTLSERSAAASQVIVALQSWDLYRHDPLAKEIVQKIMAGPLGALDWERHPHSAGFMAQNVFHRSGKTLDKANAQDLSRFCVERRNGVVCVPYRIPEGTEHLPSTPISL